MAYYKLKIEIQLVCEDFSNSYGLKIFNIEDFEDFNLIDHKLSKVLINKLKDWYNEFDRCEIEEMLNFQNVIRNHEGEILNYFKTNQTNAFAESLNAKIQRYMMESYGFRNRDFFHFRIKKMLS